MMTEADVTDKARAWDAVAKAHADERKAVVEYMRDAIEQGYPAPANKRGKCSHDKFYFEECIACYDDFLFERLKAVCRGDHLNPVR